MLWSESTGGFYNEAVHRDIPKDAIELTSAEYKELISPTSQLMVIKKGASGRPELFPAEAKPLTEDQIETRRLSAYGDPVKGSDRYFAEAIRCEAMGKFEDAEAARKAGIARYEEIRNEFPWGL